MCFHADKGIKGIGRERWQAAFLGFRPPSPHSRLSFSIAFGGPRRRLENVCSAHFEAQPGYDGSNKNFQKVSRMFPWRRERLMMTHSYN